MSLYIQHGHGKADRISLALQDGCAEGVIIGSRNERQSSLETYVAELHESYSCQVLFDPQFYVCTLVPPNDRYLPEYNYYTAGRAARDFIRATNVQKYVQQVLDYEAAIGADRLISPSVLFKSFSERWCQVALQLADTSIAYHATLDNAPPLLVSVVVGESALSSRAELVSFLDELTLLDMAGIYLVVARDHSSYSQRFDETRLANLLYLVHVLGKLNGLEVVCGYSDFVGYLLRAAGASSFATGWFQSTQRQFSENTFRKRKSGGKQGRLRYSSSPLLNSIMLSDVQGAHDVDELSRVLSGVELDSVISDATSPEASSWNQRNSEIHHWQTLSKLDAGITGDPKADVDLVIEAVRSAEDSYRVLKANGVAFERSTDSDHLQDWIGALQSFKTIANL